MLSIFRHLRTTAVLTSLIVLSLPALAAGEWMGFRNDTSITLVIQETVSVGAATRPGKPQKIFANETIRDTPPSGSARTFTIYDAAHPDKPLYVGKFKPPQANENVLYILKRDGKGEIVVESVRPVMAGTTHAVPKR